LGAFAEVAQDEHTAARTFAQQAKDGVVVGPDGVGGRIGVQGGGAFAGLDEGDEGLE
jgi:hypothetical protein